jgi:hypothetical protein
MRCRGDGRSGVYKGVHVHPWLRRKMRNSQNGHNKIVPLTWAFSYIKTKMVFPGCERTAGGGVHVHPCTPLPVGSLNAYAEQARQAARNRP